MSRQALLIIGIQNGRMSFMPEEEKQSYLSLLSSTIDIAHYVSIPVIHVITAFRRGLPEIGNRDSGGLELFLEGQEMAAIHPSVIVHDDKGHQDMTIVTKRRASAFHATDLDVLLKGLQVSEIVLAGVPTGGTVLSTMRQAADMDYKVTVLEDGCWDEDEELHRVLMERVFPKQVRVIQAKRWVSEISTGRKLQFY